MIDGIRARARRFRRISMLMLFFILLLCAVHMMYGNTIYTPAEIWEALTVGGQGRFTIVGLRLPRMLTGLLAGISFGMAGSIFQKLLRNPLASPDIIGITSGSSAAAVFAILVLGWSGPMVSVLSLISGFVVACTIFLLGKQGNEFHNRFILIGIGMQAFLNAAISWMLLKASEYDVASALRWMSGSLNGSKMENAFYLLPALLVTFGMVLVLSAHLEVIELGEAFSVTLGSQPGRVMLLLMLAALGMSAFATAACGPIASVAFLAGPIAHRIAGNHRYSVIAAGEVGAILVLGADLAGQYLFPSRYPVGVITGILGAPYLLYLLMRMNQKGIRM